MDGLPFLQILHEHYRHRYQLKWEHLVSIWHYYMISNNYLAIDANDQVKHAIVIVTYILRIFFFFYRSLNFSIMAEIQMVILIYPGRIGTVVNDRLRRKTEIYGGRTRTPHTGTVYDVKRSETDSVYGDRVKIRSD
jgi:hypothetical protein